MITVCILTKNVEGTIRATLESTKKFPEVLLLDSGSTDRTFEIGGEFPNVKIVKTAFKGFGPLRNEAAALAKHDWILALDSDEVLSPPLLAEIDFISLKPEAVYSIPRHNFYNGKQIKGCGWHPERVERLYHRHNSRFSDAAVHEALPKSGAIYLESPILHTPYRSTADFLAKMQLYTTLFAEQHKNKRMSSFYHALAHGAFSFFRSYLIKGGIFDGAEGFSISLYNANTAFYKYMKLAEANRSL